MNDGLRLQHPHLRSGGLSQRERVGGLALSAAELRSAAGPHQTQRPSGECVSVCPHPASLSRVCVCVCLMSDPLGTDSSPRNRHLVSPNLLSSQKSIKELESEEGAEGAGIINHSLLSPFLSSDGVCVSCHFHLGLV